jgi:hypothetical protein
MVESGIAVAHLTQLLKWRRFMTLIASSVVETCEIIRDPAEFLALEDNWRSLFDRVPGAYVAQSFDWCRAGWETIAAPRGRRLLVLVLLEAERAVLIWPLVEAKYGRGACCGRSAPRPVNTTICWLKMDLRRRVASPQCGRFCSGPAASTC